MDPISQWQIIGQSVRGAAHERQGTPNQDAIGWLPKSGVGSSLAVSLADGHGSARYVRSHIGSRLAVKTSTRLIYSFAARHKDAANLSLIKRTAEEWLPQALARAWFEAVKEHLQENPLSIAEAQAVKGKDTAEDHTIAYGTTLVAAGVTDAFVIYLQIGDGEILTVTDGSEVKRPVPNDERLIANETTSLCAENAWRDFRVAFQPLTKSRPSLILLATDGYPNSFRNESGFLQAGSDMLKTLRAEGVSRVRHTLPDWLRDTTRKGSGDDVTLAILYPGKTRVQNQKRRPRPHKSKPA
ncbi:MAG TPA: PP2C family serine/threonine-protein phosphatase [Pyrinomonadaceae bacterium]|nr:PP2C family serine/threonine-protein phosphatase [Pyrinomonadaceae bacterium]